MLMKDHRIIASGGINVMFVENLSELYGFKITLHKRGGHYLVIPE